MRKILVVAAHPDDEVLGCGGTLARHHSAGDHVEVVFMADGVGSRASATHAEVLRRMAAARDAHAILGVSGLHSLAFPDNRMDTVPFLDVAQALERILDAFAPEVIYTHHHGDLNVDHRITHRAVLTAARPLPGASVREIYAFEVLSSTEWAPASSASFSPTLFVDIETTLPKKLAALASYSEEMRKPPHARSIAAAKALAHARGFSVGYSAAEAFETLRMLK